MFDVHLFSLSLGALGPGLIGAFPYDISFVFGVEGSGGFNKYK